MTSASAWGTRPFRTAPSLAFALTLVTLTAPSLAAEDAPSLALSALEPTPPGDAFVAVPSPFAGGHLIPRGSVGFDYAHQPLVLESASTEGNVVGGQGILHVGASVSFWDRLLLSLSMPMLLLEDGDAPSAGGVAFAEPGSFTLGDLRIGARVRIVGTERDPIALGLGAYLHVPTGETPSFVAEGAVRDTPQLSLGGSIGSFQYAAMGGFSIRGGDNPSAVIYAAGAGVTLLERMLTLGVEGFGSTDIQDGYVTVGGERVERTDKTSAELMLEARVRPLRGMIDGLSIGVYGGPGLSQAIGTPAFRAGGVLRWDPFTEAMAVRALDSDADTVPDTEDPCPYEAGSADAPSEHRGCPATPAPSAAPAATTPPAATATPAPTPPK